MMKLTIALRKDVADLQQAQSLTNIVSEKLEEYPDIEISASASEQMTIEQD